MTNFIIGFVSGILFSLLIGHIICKLPEIMDGDDFDRDL